MEKYFKHKLKGRSPIVIVGYVIFGIFAVTAMAILFGYIIMSLWNWLMPELFDLPVISYWQAVGLFILAKFLFGFGSSGGGGSKGKKSNCKDEAYGENQMKNRDFSKWAHYDKFWEEKGEKAYTDFVEELEKSRHKNEDNNNTESK
ncbi:MAG: hypothetical protein KDC83_09070 [Flavobacteriales bacterium]|nr:hypothetical protein [Flavobacteriales bacterium]